MMATASAALPPPSFATGSAVINMIRQTGLAIGVAVLVAIVGAPGSQLERLAAFRNAWRIMAAIVAIGLIPTLLLRQPRAKARRSPPASRVAILKGIS